MTCFGYSKPVCGLLMVLPASQKAWPINAYEWVLKIAPGNFSSGSATFQVSAFMVVLISQLICKIFNTDVAFSGDPQFTRMDHTQVQ